MMDGSVSAPLKLTTQRVEEMADWVLKNTKDVYKYTLDVSLVLHRRPVDCLPPLTPEEIAEVSHVSMPVYMELFKIPTGPSSGKTLREETLHLYEYKYTVSNVITKLRHLRTLPHAIQYADKITDDLSYILSVYPDYLNKYPSAMRQQRPTPPTYSSLNIHIPSAVQSPAPPPPPSVATQASTSKFPVELHLRTYGYAMRNPAHLRQQALQSAMRDYSVDTVMNRVRHLYNTTKSNVLQEDLAYLQTFYPSTLDNPVPM